MQRGLRPPTPSHFQCHMATHPDVPAPKLTNGQGTSPRQGDQPVTPLSAPHKVKGASPTTLGHFCPVASILFCLPVSCHYEFCSRRY